ncbi:MAG TPA: PAS domain S-box protein, partial [Chitinophagaceae bacterium]|nr:PAS domain S-box protein [Chitinophagaceae bacterium]
MKLSVNNILTSGIVVIIVAITVVLFVSVRQSKQQQEIAHSIEHTEMILDRLQQLTLFVLDNETGARGFVITGKDAFLEPVETSLAGIDTAFHSLDSLIKFDNIRRLLTDSLKPYLDKRVDFSHRMINTYKQWGKDSASMLVLGGTGKYYTDRIRQLTDSIHHLENILLDSRKQKNNNTIRGLNLLLYSTLGISVILGFVLIQRTRSDVNKQQLNEKKFSALLDAAPDATVIVNEKGLIQMINLQVENLFGYTRDELIGKPVEILIPSELRHKHTGHRSDFVKEARIRSMGAGIELKAVRKDNTSFPVEISLSPIKTKDGLLVSASVRDITNRKKSEEKFRSLLDSAPDATVIVDEKGTIQMINHQTENLFGYMRDELIGKPVEILIPADLHGKHHHHRASFANAPRVRAMGAGIELHAVKKGGAMFPVEISLSPIQTEEGMLVSASVRDITMRKELETELKKTNAELEAFTYSVSHDLRAPLRGIIGFTAILEEDYTSQLDDEARRITSVIKSNTMKMGHLIDDLLAFSRTGKQELVKSDINSKALAIEVIDDLKQQYNTKNIAWTIYDLIPVKADINTIRQVWINLIANAIKYSGSVDSPEIEIGSFFNEGQVVFYVKDNGVGFDQQYKHKLFKVFQRL